MSKVEQSSFKKGLEESGAQRASEKSSLGHIGKVVNYHPNTGNKTKEGFKGGMCDCDRHNGQRMEAHEMHTVDVDILRGSKMQRMHAVPCFVYSQGLIDKGFKKNDRVWIQYINGDYNMPIATAYYREPDQLDLFWNNLRYRVGNFFDDILSIGDE